MYTYVHIYIFKMINYFAEYPLFGNFKTRNQGFMAHLIYLNSYEINNQ